MLGDFQTCISVPLSKSILMGSLIYFSILNFYFCNHDVYNSLDHIVMLATNSAPGGSITD